MVKDADLFAAAMADVKPLRPRRRAARLAAMPKKRAAAPASTTARAKATAEEVAARLAAPRPRPPVAPVRPEMAVEDRAFDRDISRSLSRGKLVPQASIDLHGMTVAAAERAVTRFLDDATARDLRVVLVVTGKGVRLEGGRVFGGLLRPCLDYDASVRGSWPPYITDTTATTAPVGAGKMCQSGKNASSGNLRTAVLRRIGCGGKTGCLADTIARTGHRNLGRWPGPNG